MPRQTPWTPSRSAGSDPAERDTLPCHDASRMGALLGRLQPRLVGAARRILRDPDAAEDVVQSAFEKVLRRCEQFRGGAQPSTWMHRIVVNEALMWIRRERRREARAPEHEADAQGAAAAERPDAAASRAQEQERLYRALAALPTGERRVLEAAALGGRGYAELSRELGLSTEGIKSRAFRARRRLREALGAS